MASRASSNIPPSLRKIWEDQEKYGRGYISPTMERPTKTRAIVCHDTLKSDGWKIDEVLLRPLQPGELLVEMVASGVCHTDAFVGNLDAGSAPIAFYPRVLGHEGSGYVREVASGVDIAAVGDPVLLSFDFCNECALCTTEHRSNCVNSIPLNFGPHREVFKLASATSSRSDDVGGHFFGQSSFANFSIVKQTSVANVRGLVEDKQELQLFAPLGCGIQTGSGTVLNVAKAGPEDVICIMGLGGVGLAAIMAAKNSNCRAIIGIDRIESRLTLAKDLGATHVLNSSALPSGKTLSEIVKAIADGAGPTITIDTTGAPPLIIEGMNFTRNCGKYIQVGAPPMDFTLSSVNCFEFMNTGKQLLGAIEGAAYPKDYIPKMIRWYKEGKFPIDRLMKMLPAEDFKQALQEMKEGSCIKPIITWS